MKLAQCSTPASTLRSARTIVPAERVPVGTGDLGPPPLVRGQQSQGEVIAADTLLDLAGEVRQAGRIGGAGEGRLVKPGHVTDGALIREDPGRQDASVDDIVTEAAIDLARPVHHPRIDLEDRQWDVPAQFLLIPAGDFGARRLVVALKLADDVLPSDALVDLPRIVGQADRVGGAAEDRLIELGDVAG